MLNYLRLFLQTISINFPCRKSVPLSDAFRSTTAGHVHVVITPAYRPIHRHSRQLNCLAEWSAHYRRAFRGRIQPVDSVDRGNSTDRKVAWLMANNRGNHSTAEFRSRRYARRIRVFRRLHSSRSQLDNRNLMGFSGSVSLGQKSLALLIRTAPRYALTKETLNDLLLRKSKGATINLRDTDRNFRNNNVYPANWNDKRIIAVGIIGGKRSRRVYCAILRGNSVSVIAWLFRDDSIGGSETCTHQDGRRFTV